MHVLGCCFPYEQYPLWPHGAHFLYPFVLMCGTGGSLSKLNPRMFVLTRYFHSLQMLYFTNFKHIWIHTYNTPQFYRRTWHLTHLGDNYIWYLVQGNLLKKSWNKRNWWNSFTFVEVTGRWLIYDYHMTPLKSKYTKISIQKKHSCPNASKSIEILIDHDRMGSLALDINSFSFDFLDLAFHSNLYMVGARSHWSGEF